MITDSRLIDVGCFRVGDPSGLDIHRHMLASDARPFRVAREQAINAFEHDYISRLLQETGGNVTEAAKLAGKERRSFGKIMKKHGIDYRTFR